MVQELGKINKPDAENYKKGRKIYLVTLIHAGENAPQELTEKLSIYWKQVAEHIRNLEQKIGKIKHVYHEAISESGENGIKIMESMKLQTCEIIKDKCQAEAVLEAMEDRNLLEETLDWQRCLFSGISNQTVAQKVTGFYIEASKSRYEFIGNKINETLLPEESAILFINERHMIQFPPDIQVFRVAPPSLDEIYKWLRDQSQSEDKTS